jgi:streptogrisin D
VRITGSTSRKIALLGVAAGATLVAALAAPTAGAAPTSAAGTSVQSGSNAAVAAVNAVSDRQVAQGTLAASLTHRYGARTAGSYLDANGAAVVNVLDAATATAVKAAGATPRLVSRTTAQLAAAQSTLEKSAHAVGTIVATDPATNQVVVSLTDSVSAADQAKVRSAAARMGGAVRVEHVAGTLNTLISGGDAILVSGARCSLGFNARNAAGTTFYVITAGHCTNIGATWSTSGGTVFGSRVATSFPSNDYGVIQYTNTSVAHPGNVNLYNGTTQDITRSANASVGQSACRSGSTTHVHCGTVTAVNASVTYPQGTVNGLIRTNICAEPGDSGGSLYSGSTALGMTSGGSGNCSSGGTTFFQPVTEPLGLFGLSVF